MPKNYFIGEETDKSLYAKYDRECRLCISYNIMELKEGYDINDPNRRTQFTELFERFTELFEKKFENPKPANTISFFNILIPQYICAVRAGVIKRKDHSEGDFDLTHDDIMKQSETLEDKTLENIKSMIPLVASLYNRSFDRLYQEDHKILERMIGLGILRGKWRADSRV
jgi:hypothetical protein